MSQKFTQKLSKMLAFWALFFTFQISFAQVPFTETMGNSGGTVTIAAHETANGFDNDAFTMSGTGDIRVTLPSTGYAGASGTSNVLINTTAQNFLISGINTTGYTSLSLSFGVLSATANVLPVVAVSSDGVTFNPLTVVNTITANTWTLKTATGTIPSTANLRIRFTQSGAGLQRVDDINLTGVISGPLLTVAPTTLTGFNYGLGSGPSTSQSYNLSGTNLTGFPSNITVTAPTNYEVSNDNITFGASTTIAYASATLAATPVYVRLKAGLLAGTYNGELVANSGGGATAVNVTCSGSVTGPTLSVSTATLSGFSYVVTNGPSTSQSYNISGTNLSGAPSNITVTAPTNYEVSNNNVTFGASTTIPYASSTLAATPVYVRLKSGLGVGTYNAQTVVNSATGATNVNVTCNGSVIAPTISVSTPTLTGFSYIFSAGPSTSQTYNVSGVNLTGAPSNITVTAPTNYEVSNNNISFGASTTIPYASATLAATPVYVRLKAGLAIGTYNGQLVVNSAANATSVNVTCDGQVFGPPVITSSLTASGTTSSAFTYTITATNSPTVYSASPLPAGLSINTATSVISGTPTTVGTTNVTITATNAAGTDTETLVITISTFVYLAGDYRSTVDYTNFSFNNGAGLTNNWEYFNGTSWGPTPGDKAPANAAVTPSRVIVSNVGINGAGNTTKTYNDIIILGGGELILTDNDVTPTVEFIPAGKKIEVLSGGILDLEGDIDLNPTGNLIVRAGGLMIIDQNTITNNHPMWDGVENFENNSTVEVRNWNFAASATNASLINVVTGPSYIASNVDGWKFGNLTYNIPLANIGALHWTAIGGGVGVINLVQNDYTITNGGTGYMIGATNRTGFNGFIVNGNMNVTGNYTFGSNFAANDFDHRFTINGNFSHTSGSLKTHFRGTATLALTIAGFVNFKGNVTVSSTSTFDTDKATNDSRVFVNFNGTSTQLVNIGCTVSGVNMFVKNGATVQLDQNNLVYNSLTGLITDFRVENGATLHFGWSASNTPLIITELVTPVGTPKFTTDAGSTLKITSADGITTTASLGNVQITPANRTYNQDATFWYVGKVNQNTGNAVSTSIRNLTIETNTSTLVVTMNSNNIGVNSFLTLTSGVLQTGSFKVITINTTAANLIHISGSSSYVNGNLRRFLATNTSTYELPLGYSNNVTDYHPADLVNNNLAGISFVDTKVYPISESGNNVDTRITTTQFSQLITDVKEIAIWSIVPNASPSSGNYGVKLYTNNISGLSDNNFFAVKRADASTDYADWNTFEGSTTVPANNNAGRTVATYAQRLGYTTFSENAIGVTVIPLPVQVLKFNGNWNENNIDLKWNVGKELNLDRYEVEKSLNGVQFENLGSVSANNNQTYSITDNSPQNINYYRLKMIDNDGKFNYSETIQLNKNQNFTVSVYPNPTTRNFNLNIQGKVIETLEFEMINVEGKVILSKVATPLEINNLVNSKMNEINSGVYILKIKVDGQVQNLKWIKL